MNMATMVRADCHIATPGFVSRPRLSSKVQVFELFGEGSTRPEAGDGPDRPFGSVSAESGPTRRHDHQEKMA